MGGVVARAMLGIVLGLVFGWGHLWMLRQALEGSQDDHGIRARQMILRGFPVRLLLWAPPTIVAIRAGLPAMLGLLAGMVASRWLYWHSMMQPR